MVSQSKSADVEILTGAVWQVLDDMGASGVSCCLAAKAALRVAYEPFINDLAEIEGWMPLAEAQRILKEVEL